MEWVKLVVWQAIIFCYHLIILHKILVSIRCFFFSDVGSVDRRRFTKRCQTNLFHQFGQFFRFPILVIRNDYVQMLNQQFLLFACFKQVRLGGQKSHLDLLVTFSVRNACEKKRRKIYILFARQNRHVLLVENICSDWNCMIKKK